MENGFVTYRNDRGETIKLVKRDREDFLRQCKKDPTYRECSATNLKDAGYMSSEVFAKKQQSKANREVKKQNKRQHKTTVA
jgi:hypothetical protein